MSAVQGLPSIEEVAAKFAPAAPTGPAPVAERPLDESSAKGGTTSAPVEKLSVTTSAPAPAAEPVAGELAAETVEEEPKQPPKPDLSASRFAALARREKEARAREAAAEQKVKDAEARSKALEERDSKWARIKQDPLSALKEAGMSLSDIVNASYGKYEAPAADPLDEKLKPLLERSTKTETQAEALLKQVEELRNQLAQREQSEQYDRVMGGIQTELKSDPDKYELITSFGDEGENLVRDTMVEYWKVNQKVLDYSEACDIVEKHYEEQYLARISKTKKLAARMAQPSATPAAAAALKASTPAQKPKEPSSTLNNRMATAPQANVDIDKMSKKEAIEYLAKKLVFTE